MHVYLVGYRGTGKSTIGRMLSARLQMPCVDCDDLVEQSAGRSIREIFDEEGEVSFRDREQSAIQQLAESAEEHPRVVALGGGAVLREANRVAVSSSGYRIWLTATPTTILQRIQDDPTTARRRPALSALSDYEEIVSMLAAREPLYASIAQKIVDTESVTAEAMIDNIVDWLKSAGAT